MSTKCITPYHVQDKFTGNYIPVPCSKCPPCMKRRTSGWSYRLIKEGERSSSALFVTLTYNTEYVPITEKGYMNLDKTDIQKFFKRLRKLSKTKIKYYVCGEYGIKKMRPHYHIILFNANKEHIQKAWILNNKPLGTMHIGQVNEATIGYTLKYMTKKGKIPLHYNDNRQKEFSLMSKRLGDNYITKKMIDWHKKDLEKDKIAMYLKDIAEKETEKLQTELGETYEKVMVERHINQFKKMYKNAEIGRQYE